MHTIGNLNYRILATYDSTTITVYQAYNQQIAEEALRLGRFGDLFKRTRMTWIKPSFLWMMYRSSWGTAPNQERILAIKLSRKGFDTILARATLSKYVAKVHSSQSSWRTLLKNLDVRCQWDPDRTQVLAPMTRRAIQLGLKGQTASQYVDEWCLNITDFTNLAHQMRKLVNENKLEQAGEMLPTTAAYPVTEAVAKQLGML